MKRMRLVSIGSLYVAKLGFAATETSGRRVLVVIGRVGF